MNVTFLTSVLGYIKAFAIVGGGLLCLWGLITLGTNIKDHNGPGIQQAIWQVVGGALIIAAGILFCILIFIGLGIS